MNSFFRLSALCVFAAAGVGIAVCLATSTRLALPKIATGSQPAKKNVAAGAKPQADVPEVTVTAAEAAPIDERRALAPHAEYAQQFPPDPQPPPPATPATPQIPAQPSFGDLLNSVKSMTDAMNARNQAVEQQINAEQNTLRGAAGAQREKPSQTAADDEGDGLPLAPGAQAPANQGPLRTAPSSFKVIKLPGEGDDRLSVHIQNKDLREVLDFLGEHGGMSILCSANVQGQVSVSLTDVSIDEALAAILKSTGYISRRDGKFVYVGTPKDMQTAAQSIDRIATRVYRPNYVKASELQALIMPLLSPAGTFSGGTQAAASFAVSPPAQNGIPADGTQTGGDTFAQGEVLVVRDYEAVLAEIDQLVAEIDKRPLQVQIEAMLLSVQLKDTNTFGVDFQFLRNQQHLVMATGSPLADIGQVSFTDGGLKLGFLDSSLGAFLAALQTIGDTNVIATPRLMCLNKHKAEILIGQQLGYVTKTLTQTTTAQSVEFLQVGTQLRLRPFISTDGLIRMEVHPEISTGSVDVVEGFTLPNKDVTQVTTNIMVRDGCTVVIGGLMQESLAATGSQLPLLGSTPGIGFLFRNRKNTQTRTEIIVLITPHIAYEPEACMEGDKAACDFHRQHAVYKDQMAPLNSRYTGRKFFRLAQNAWANDDKKSAMRFINLAIHYDPSNRAAIDLRSDIVAGNHFGDHTTPGVSPGIAPTEAFNGQEIAPWVLDGLEQGLVEPKYPPHPRDPGAPTRAVTIERAGNFR